MQNIFSAGGCQPAEFLCTQQSCLPPSFSVRFQTQTVVWVGGWVMGVRQGGGRGGGGGAATLCQRPPPGPAPAL